MAVAIHKGTIKELGPAVEDAQGIHVTTTFSYIELTDGRMLRRVIVGGGLIGKLDGALQDDQSVELHVLAGTRLRKTQMLLAIKMADGKLYAIEPDFNAFPFYIGIFVLVLLGIATIWVFGLGLMFLAFAWYVWHSVRIIKTGMRHVRNLPSPVLL